MSLYRQTCVLLEIYLVPYLTTQLSFFLSYVVKHISNSSFFIFIFLDYAHDLMTCSMICSFFF